jgi:NAD-dependent dihydropyrimidine dehydrogenase PreA subunit
MVPYVVAEPCVDVLDRACVDECPVDCIYQGERMVYIQPDECVDCGACEPVCPVEAIYHVDDLPEEWSAFTGINAEAFARVWGPDGAAGAGRADLSGPGAARPTDPEAVRLLPARKDR